MFKWRWKYCVLLLSGSCLGIKGLGLLCLFGKFNTVFLSLRKKASNLDSDTFMSDFACFLFFPVVGTPMPLASGKVYS